MKFKKDSNFLKELKNYNFLCFCEKCIHYNSEENSCSLFWPNGDHLEKTYENPEISDVIFCKEFDLDER